MKKKYKRCFRVNTAILNLQNSIQEYFFTTHKKKITFSAIGTAFWEIMLSDDEFRQLVIAKIEAKIIQKNIDTSFL